MPEDTSDSRLSGLKAQRRVVGVLTTSRADAGISRWIVEELERSTVLQPLLIRSGVSSLLDYGIEHESPGDVSGLNLPVVGSTIASRGDSPAQVAKWVAECMLRTVDLLESSGLSALLVVGDRIEVLAVAEAAVIMGIPLAHVHGGETSFGAVDERCRHAITKLADVHFVATTEFGRRVVQLGESWNRVFVVGSPGLCALERVELATRPEVEEFLGLPTGAPYFLATFHPVTTEPMESIRDLDALLQALAEFPDHHVVFTGVNVDPGYELISAMINEFATANENCILLTNLGHERYLAALRYAEVCVGNSSSGIIEAPALGTPTLNVGRRQDGRSRATSIFDASSAEGNIGQALAQALSARESELIDPNPPYGSGGASARIVKILEELVLEPHSAKIFNDCPLEQDEAGADVPNV